MNYIVLGGGCYGTFYARQLLRARDAGALDRSRVWVVDRNESPPAKADLPSDADLRFLACEWDSFLDGHLKDGPREIEDRIVPSPFTPHLALAWLLRRLPEDRPELSWRLEPFRRMPGTPWQLQREGGPLLLSHADWTCPVHCIEPATCPHTGGPRHWDLDRTVDHFAEALEEGGQPVQALHLFHCHHVTHGVGAYPASEIVRSRREIVAGARTGSRFLVGTISHCHGALHLLVADGAPPEGAEGKVLA